MPDTAIDLTKGLRAWADVHEVSPVQFSEKTNYKYAYAWDLLRGKGTFTQESLGRFVFAYGIEAAAEVLKLAGDERIVKVNGSKVEAEGMINVIVRRTPLSLAE